MRYFGKYLLSYIFFRGRYKKYPPPDGSGVGYRCIPRFHPGYGITPSLIAAVTGAPGRPFPTCGSEVVTRTAGVRKPFSKMASSLGILPRTHIFVSAFARKNLAYFFSKVNPQKGKKLCRRGKKFVESGEGSKHNALVTEFYKRLHNPTTYVNKCNFLTQDIAKSDGLRPISCI